MRALFFLAPLFSRRYALCCWGVLVGFCGSAQITFSTLPQDSDVNCTYVPPAETLVATSTCGGPVDVQLSEVREAETCAHSYRLRRTWLATDQCGNTARHVQLVTVTDDQAPIITGVPPNATVAPGQARPPLNVGVVDFCDPDATLDTERDSVPGACGGYALVYRYTARDACNNRRTARYILSVSDDDPPVISGVTPGRALSCGESLPPPPTVTVSDNGGAAVLTMRTDTTVNHGGDTCKVVSRVWMATDDCGLTAEAAQRFAFLDGNAPTLSGVPADAVIYCEALPAAPAPYTDVTATDDCDPAPVITYAERSEQTNNGTCSDQVYRVIRTWTAVDACGNETVAEQVLQMKCECCANGIDDDDDGLVDDYDPQCNCFAGVEAACDSMKRYYIPTVLRQDGADFNRPSEIVVTTLAPVANIHVETADGTTYNRNFTVTKGTPLRIPLTTAEIMTQAHDRVERDKGFVITSDQLIQPIYRIDSKYNKVLVTIKGPQALGRVFRAASQTYVCDDNNANWDEGHFISVMATEDDTEVTIDYKFPAWGGLTGPVTRRLNRHETYLIRDDHQNTTVSGSLITSTKPIAVLTGSQHTRACKYPNNDGTFTQGQDGGIDQLVPNCLTGDEYVMVRGKGAPVQQYAILVANKNNTRVVVDGDVSRELVLQAGDYEQVWLDGGEYDAKHFKANKPFYAFQVAGISNNNEVGMAICGPVGECKGDTLIEFPKFSTSFTGAVPDNSVYVITQTSGLPSLRLNGQPYGTCAAAKPVPSRPDLSVVTFNDACLAENNRISSDTRFTAGMLVGVFRESGTHGYLTSFKDRMEVRHPRSGEVTTAYFVDTLCGTATLNHCVDVSSCATSHSIAAARVTHGSIALSGGPCFEYTPPSDFQGVDEALVTLQNDQGLFQTVCLSFYVCASPPSVAFPFTDTTVTCEGVPPIVPPTMSDECDMRVEFEAEEVRADGFCDYAYRIERHWLFWDECGDSTRASQSITVVDTSAPIALNVPSDTIIASCAGVPPQPEVRFRENCDNDFQYRFSQTTVDSTCANDYTIVRTWEAWDECGNRSTATQRIELRDTAAPLLSGVPGDVVLACNDPVPTATVTASDDCDPDLPVVFEEIAKATTCDTTLNIERRWTATDACGRVTTATQRIYRVDQTPPVVLGAPADTTIACGQPLPTAAPSFDDDCASLSVVFEVDSVATGSCPVIERIYRTWSVTDACGDVTSTRQVVSVVDTAAPRFVPLPDTVFSSCFDSIVIVEPEVVESCNLTLTYTDSVAAGSLCNGERYLWRDYLATDACGREARYRQLYYFRDTVPPVWVAEPQDVTLACGDALPPVIDPNFVDACSGLNPVAVAIRDSSRICPATRYIIRDYTVSDWCGNLTYFRHVITVEGCEPVLPVLASGQAGCTGEDIVLNVRVDSGYTTPVYQWQVDRGAGFVALGPPTTEREYRLPDATPAFDGTYRVNVANSVAELGDPDCSTFSNAFDLAVRPPRANTQTHVMCKGDTLFYLGDALTSSQTRVDTLQTTYGCDSVATLELTVETYVQWSIDTVLCFGESLTALGQTYTASGTYRDTVAMPSGCDSTLSLTLSVLPDHRDTIRANICPGESVTFADSSYATAGTFLQPLTSVDGCDSTQVLVLALLDTAATLIDTVVCPGETVTVAGEVFGSSGSFTRILSTRLGCDSTVRLRLRVVPDGPTEISAHVCFGETYFFGDRRLTEAGVYTRTLPSTYGCDSTVRLTLRASPRYDTEVRAELCEGDIYRNGSYSLASAGRWPLQFYTADGCDSTVYVTLVYRRDVTERLDVTLCRGESFAVFDTSYATAGTYTRAGRTLFGCDSTVELSLDVADPTRTVLRETLCFGEGFVAAGQTFISNTLDSFVLAGRAGCDSLVVVDVRFRENNISNRQQTVCFGETVTFGGRGYDTTGTYVARLTDQYGCDSTARLELTVLPELRDTLAVSICVGDAYDFGGVDYEAAGTYEAVVAGTGGCDSTVVLQLTVNDTSRTRLTADLCTGETYEFGGRTLREPGVYTAAHVSAEGCDSTVELTLNARPRHELALDTTVCAGASVRFGDLELSSAGEYVQRLQSMHGCDSTVRLRISYFAPAAAADTVHVCEGGGVEVAGTWRTQTGAYPSTHASAAGCDSTHTLQLYVHANVIRRDTARLCFADSVAFDGAYVREAGTYVAEYESAYGCDSTVVLEVIIDEEIRLAADDALICAGNSVTLTARGYDGPVRWSPDVGLSCTRCPSPVATPSETTVYTVSAVDCRGRAISAEAEVRVRPTLSVETEAERRLRLGESTRLRAVASDPDARTEWRQGDVVLCSDCAEVEVRPLVSTTYEVSARVADGCEATDRLTIVVEDDCLFADIQIPNVLTPNGDGANDLFEIRYEGIKDIVLLRIYNRWGEVVFETEDIDVFWDGTHRGMPLNPGVFVYYMEGHCINEEPFTEEGNVTLVR